MFSKKLFGGTVGMAIGMGLYTTNRPAAAQSGFLDTAPMLIPTVSYYGLGRSMKNLRLFNPVPNDFPVRGPHEKLSPAFEEDLSHWAEDTTRKFQSLDFTPDDLAVDVAFLRLLGVQRISLEDLGRERGSTHCFIRRVPVIPNAQPTLTLTLDDVLNTIEEFRPDSKRHLRSLYPAVSDPVAHIKPAVVDSVTISLDSHALEDLYKKMSQLSDIDIINMVKKYLGDESSLEQKTLLATNLRNARTVCQEYIAHLDYEQNPGITPSKR